MQVNILFVSVSQVPFLTSSPEVSALRCREAWEGYLPIIGPKC